MSSDLLDDWDENFLEQAIKLEENYAATAAANFSSRNPPLTTTSSLPQISQQQRSQPPQPSSAGTFHRAPSCGSHGIPSRFTMGRDRHHQSFGGPRNVGSDSFSGILPREDRGAGFSPPRELSQRFLDKPDARMDRATDSLDVADRRGFGSGKKNGVEKTKFDDLNISSKWTSYVTSEDNCTSQRKSEHFDERLLDDESTESAKATKIENKNKRSFIVSELKHSENGPTSSIGYVNQMSNEMVGMAILLDILVSMCFTDNYLIVYRSLRILRGVLQITFNYEVRCYKRDLCVYSQFNCNTEYKYSSELLKNDGVGDSLCISMDKCASLVETMQRIVLKSGVECIQKEVLRVMILIVMESDPISEREKFGFILSESFSKFLCKEVGVNVQKQALQLLFLLLNCPNLMLSFINQHQNETNQEESSEGQPLNCILKGLFECIHYSGKSIMEHKVQKKAVIVLAFIASSGQAGFEILLKSVTPQGANFLDLIIQILAMDIDAHVTGPDKSQELLNERIFVMREALILLNRLASNACYSKVVLAVVTRSAASTSLTIDAANKISRRSRECRKYDQSSKISMMEAETLDLARSIRARVLSFLGENIS